MTTPSGRIAVEATEVHWGVGSKGGSPTRQGEEAAIRAGVVRTFSAETNPIPGIVRAVESKGRKRYNLDGDEDLWLLLLGGSPSAPGSTFVFPPFLDLARLSGRTHEQLTRSGFSRCYLFCEVAVPGPALYGWDRNSSWQQNICAAPEPEAQPAGELWFMRYLRDPAFIGDVPIPPTRVERECGECGGPFTREHPRRETERSDGRYVHTDQEYCAHLQRVTVRRMPGTD